MIEEFGQVLGQIVGYDYYNIVPDQGVCWAFYSRFVRVSDFSQPVFKRFLNGREILVTGKFVQVSSQLLEIALAVAITRIILLASITIFIQPGAPPTIGVVVASAFYTESFGTYFWIPGNSRYTRNRQFLTGFQHYLK